MGLPEGTVTCSTVELRATGKPDYRSPHFPDDPGLLLHTRANDRTLPKLGRGTFMEEGQSDLHQAGRKMATAISKCQLLLG
jgi:hypothetical protein